MVINYLKLQAPLWVHVTFDPTDLRQWGLVVDYHIQPFRAKLNTQAQILETGSVKCCGKPSLLDVQHILASTANPSLLISHC